MDFLKDLNVDKVRNLAEDAFNQVKPKNEVEQRVYEVLSHKNWGSSTTLMNEIAQDTFDYEKFLIVTKLMWDAVETPRPAAWRVIFKGLTLLEHLVKSGSERCVDDARNHSHLLRNLDKFNYYEGTVDRGVGVREKAKQVVEMLQDDDRIREDRQKARQLREKFAGRSLTASSDNAGGGTSGGEGTTYPGYGNSDSNWQSKSSGAGDVRSTDPSNNRGYAGRYGEGGVDSGASATKSKTVAVPSAKKSSKSSSSSSGTKVKKLKKKKAAATAVVNPAAPEVDLFSFDAPAATAAATMVADDSFDAFQTAAPPPPAATAKDDFGDFDQIASSAVQFNAFSAPPAAPTQQQSFDAFGGGTGSMMQQAAPSNGINMNAVNNTFGNMGIQQNQMQNQMPMSAAATPVMAHSTMAAPLAAVAPVASADNDDFGDFEDADDPFSSAKSSKESSDPLSKLISLDGLSKNPKKEVKSLNQQAINLGGAGMGAGNFGMVGVGGGGTGGGQMQGFQPQPGGQMQGFQPQPVLGTGQQGDIGEVFGQMLASENQQRVMMSQQQVAQQQQMMNQQKSNMGGGGMSMNGAGGMGMNAAGNMAMMGQQNMNQGMVGGQPHQQQQPGQNMRMMMNTMGGQQQQQQQVGGNVGMSGQQGMMQGNVGMGGQGGMMQGNTGMMGGQMQMQRQPQMNMMDGNFPGGGMGTMGGQSGQGQFR